MLVKQISIFIENKAGRIADATSCMADAGIDLRAMSVADTSGFGVLRVIVDEPDEAIRALKECGFTVNTTDVIAILVPDKPGSLSEVLAVIKEHHMDIEYMYAFMSKFEKQAVVILKIDNVFEASKVLTDNNILLLEADMLYKI